MDEKLLPISRKELGVVLHFLLTAILIVEVSMKLQQIAEKNLLSQFLVQIFTITRQIGEKNGDLARYIKFLL